MKGSEARLLDFMEGANNRYVVPVYQRKYDWKIENCEKLYEDLKKVIRNRRNSHFFGSFIICPILKSHSSGAKGNCPPQGKNVNSEK